MTKLGDRPSFLRLVRWVAVCLLIALGLTLSATSLSGYRVVQGALRTVVHGQGEALIHSVMQAMVRASRKGAQADEEALKGVLDYEAPRGLRCVVIMLELPGAATAEGTPDAGVATSAGAGDCLTPRAAWGELVTRQRPDELAAVGPRIRMVLGPPPHAGVGPGPSPGLVQPPYGVPPPPGAPWPAPPLEPGGMAPPPGPAWPGPVPQALLPPAGGSRPRVDERRRPRGILIEFVPRMAQELRGSALRTLFSGGFATLALLIAAAIFWQLSLREEKANATKERQRQLASLGEMAAVLAHELRNPLAALKGHAQLLVEQLPAGSRTHDKANRVVSEAERLEALSEDLLSFVRTTTIAPRNVDPTELLADCVAMVDDARIELQAAPAPARFYLDPERMRQVLCNLLRNALEASPTSGRVLASVRGEGRELVFSVRDFGKGIRIPDLERIFEPFYTTRAQGTGLGLPIARRLVALHGGSITAENAPDGGAVFHIRLPAVVRAAA